DACYRMKITGKPRPVLGHIDGWVKPGISTALLGVSGAGKTDLLDCMTNNRTGVSMLTGEMLINVKLCEKSFQRKTGYAQQQDLHRDTTAVREPSAMLFQRFDFSVFLTEGGSTVYFSRVFRSLITSSMR
ncbi:uncharacterized protein BO66DRAFT_311627, partial [Aspergillus aculeatinus CBS 121060]